LSISATTFFWAYLSWRLGEMARTIPHAVGALGWAFFAVQMVGVVLAFVYFGPPPMLLSILVTGLVGTAAWFTTH
jgi:hypothetical protein